MSKDINLDWIKNSGGYEWTPGSPWPPYVGAGNTANMEEEIEHSDVWYDYTRNDPNRKNPFTDPKDRERAFKVTGNWEENTKWIYESPDGGIEEIISTRRLVHIVRAYSIFKDKAKAIQVCVNRFDEETKQSFLELYDKVDADFELPVDKVEGE